MKPNLFNSVKVSRPRSNHFDLSHDVKFTCNMGELVPIMVMDTIPGDKFDLGCESLIRFQPLIAPVLHRLDVTMHYFFVPNRLLWEGWEDFITSQPTGGPVPAFPTITFTADDLNIDNQTAIGRTANYLGLPLTQEDGIVAQETVSALPFAAYQMIYNEYYRDQNLINPIDFALVDGDNTSRKNVLAALRKRAWEHDYFTAALPFAQKGAAVDLPLGQFNDVPVNVNLTPVDPTSSFEQWDTTIETAGAPSTTGAAIDVADPADTVPNGFMYAKTSELQPEATTINDLRRAFRLQEWLEKAARGGSRYVENIKAFFGITPQDARLQRPEYITGVKTPVSIAEVLNTTGTDVAPQGNMSGHGVSAVSGRSGKYFCQEHGYIIGIMSVMPKTAYQDGIPKHFIKTSPFDFYWPQFAHIGEQPVLNKEVLAFPVGGGGNDTFGYVPRYAEYKFMQNRVAGDLAGNLSFWHFGRKFDFNAPPALNEQFVTSDPRTDPFAVTDVESQHLICHVLNKVSARRPMPKFGTPTF